MTRADYDARVAELAASLEPAMRRALDERKGEILAGMGFLSRVVASLLWSAILRIVPHLARVAVLVVLSKFGEWTVNQVIDLVSSHREEHDGVRYWAR